MTDNYTPSQVATRLDVSTNTIRRWCEQYADHLSEEANGRPRIFSEQDIAVFEYVAACRTDGMTPDDIGQRLDETTLTPAEIVVPEDAEKPQIEQEPSPDIQAPALLLQAHTEALQRLTSRLENQRIDEVEQLAGQVARQRTWQLVHVAVTLVLVAAVVAMWAIP